MQFNLVCDSRCEIGEGCTWDERRGVVWWVDITTGSLHGWSPDARRHRVLQLPAPIGSLGLCRSGDLIVAMKHTVALFDPERQVLQPFARIEEIAPDARLNDGKVGPDGCFWVGTVDERPDKQDIGVLYRVRPDGLVERKADGFKCSNGLAWTPDGATMFHSDSRGPWIDRYDFDPERGSLSRRVRIARPSVTAGRPDGAACDALGHYWSAGVSAGCVNRFDRDGRLLATVSTPVPAPTMPCFAPGGVFLTSLRKGLSDAALDEYPASGGLFFAATSTLGAIVCLFAR